MYYTCHLKRGKCEAGVSTIAVKILFHLLSKVLLCLYRNREITLSIA
jgi:hypothetical protein